MLFRNHTSGPPNSCPVRAGGVGGVSVSQRKEAPKGGNRKQASQRKTYQKEEHVCA